jgi:hypothetical protein
MKALSNLWYDTPFPIRLIFLLFIFAGISLIKSIVALLLIMTITTGFLFYVLHKKKLL